MILLDSDLHRAIRSVMLDSGLQPFDKRRRVTTLVSEALRGVGDFCRSRDGRLFFFSKLERQLYDLDQRPFQHLLTSVSGLSATESGFRFILDMIQANTHRVAPVVEVHTMAYFDPPSGLLGVSDGGGGVWLRERRGDWTFTHNGDHGLLFLTEPEADPWTPDFGAGGEALKWFLDLALFAGHPLSREDQQTLDSVALLHKFFPPLRRTRMIPAALGPQGSGKTTWLRLRGNLLVGPRFDVTGLHRDREDAFIAAVTNRTVCALDNADSRIPWLEDALATYATGLRYRLRRLYTTNEEVSYEPRALLMLSSRDPQFNRPDVAERLLPFYFERPERYEPEERIFRELQARRGAIWGQLLLRLGEIADNLAETEAPSLPFRMADFAAFGWCCFAPRTEEWEALLKRLEAAQAAFASEGDGVVEALRLLMAQEGPLGPVEVGDLYKRCRVVADVEGLPFPRTSQGFGRRFTILRRVLELELGVRLREERRHERRRWVTFVPVGGDVGDAGDIGAEKVSNLREGP